MRSVIKIFYLFRTKRNMNIKTRIVKKEIRIDDSLILTYCRRNYSMSDQNRTIVSQCHPIIVMIHIHDYHLTLIFNMINITSIHLQGPAAHKLN